MDRNYWLDLFTWETWEEFRKAGSSITGFRESRWNSVQKIAKGDYLLCYLTGLSRFIGLLEVISDPFKGKDRDIWKNNDFPCRLEVKPLVELSPETSIPVIELRDNLSFFENLKTPYSWGVYFRGSPFKFKPGDGKVIAQALLDAKSSPTKRPYDERKLKYRPLALRAKIGSVTVPEDTVELSKAELIEDKGPSIHTEMQWNLLKLGSDMGFHVWVARNDRGKDFKGNKFSVLPKLKNELPLQFDDATNKTIELIDVLWLDGNAIIAAFEIESTTSIYSGLLRMSDLIAMQPNLNIPLYLVAPDERRERVMTEVNRPTFTRLKPPLSEICRFISFSALKDQIQKAEAFIRYLKPEFLEELSESCVLEEV